MHRMQPWTRRAQAIFVASVVLYAVVVMASMRANFLPSGVEGWVVVGSSSLLGLALLPALSRQRMARLSPRDRRWAYFFAWLGAAVLWAPMVGVVIPVGSSYVSAAPVEKRLTVSRKRAPSHRTCSGLVVREYERLLDNTICVSGSLWESISPGDTIRAVGVENRLGFRVRELDAR